MPWPFAEFMPNQICSSSRQSWSKRHASRATESRRTVGRNPAGWQRAADFLFRRASRAARRDNSDRFEDAVYARNVRGRTGLTQAAFAAQIGVPVETVRNWEQGKRSPRGPARALLKVIDGAPEAAFAVLGGKRRDSVAFVGVADAGVSTDIPNVPSVEANGARIPLARAWHLGFARTCLCARGRAGLAARLPAHRHRRNVRQ